MTFCDWLLNNRYYATGSVLAKQGTNVATAFWAGLVISIDGAFAPTGYSMVGRYVPEDVIAWILLFISLAQITWLRMEWRPIGFYGLLGYLVQWGWWLGISALIAQTRPLHITALTGSVTIAVLAAFAFGTMPRDDDVQPI